MPFFVSGPEMATDASIDANWNLERWPEWSAATGDLGADIIHTVTIRGQQVTHTKRSPGKPERFTG